MQQTHLMRTAMAGLFAFVVSPTAMAQGPCTENTCPEGYTCEEISYDKCAWDCDADGECSVDDCETVAYSACQRAECETDDECGADMVCQTFTTNCATPATPPCPPGGACPEPAPPPPCDNTEYRQCTPRTELPCEQSSDCGEGYDCLPAVVCSCSGSPTPGGAPQPSGGADATGGGTSGAPGAAPYPPDAPASPDDCTCAPSDVSYCQPQTIACENNDDCPTDWNCIQSPGSCWGDSDGNSGCSEGSSQCYPPSAPGGGPNPTSPSPGAPGNSEGDNSGGSSDPRPQLPPSPEPELPAGPGVGEEAPPRGDNSRDNGSVGGLFGLFGCSVNTVVGTGATSSPWAALALGLGAVLLRRRRR